MLISVCDKFIQDNGCEILYNYTIDYVLYTKTILVFYTSPCGAAVTDEPCIAKNKKLF